MKRHVLEGSPFKVDKWLQEAIENIGSKEHEPIRIDLTMDEIERIKNGHMVLTQYPWLKIGRK